MAERQNPWPAAAPPPPGWLPPSPQQRPAMLPVLPPRPVYREPHPIAAGPMLAGVAAALVWFALFGSIGRDLLGYAWWTLVAAISAWAVAIVLALLGNRGTAVGVALTSGLGLAIAAGLVAARWIDTSDWPLW